MTQQLKRIYIQDLPTRKITRTRHTGTDKQLTPKLNRLRGYLGKKFPDQKRVFTAPIQGMQTQNPSEQTYNLYDGVGRFIRVITETEFTLLDPEADISISPVSK